MMTFPGFTYHGFAKTRARRTDDSTSHAAAKHAVSGIAAAQRLTITATLMSEGPMTCKELARLIPGISYEDVKRRISETTAHKTDSVREGCRVWAV